MPKTYLAAVQAEDQKVNPLFTFLKARLACVNTGEAEIALPMGPYLMQGGGLTAGGVLATLADEAMAHAAMSTLSPGEHCVTAEMNIRYLRSSSTATTGSLVAKARVIKRGGNTAVCSADVFDDKGRLLAIGGGTFYVLKPEAQ